MNRINYNDAKAELCAFFVTADREEDAEFRNKWCDNHKSEFTYAHDRAMGALNHIWMFEDERDMLLFKIMFP
ncbi:MAG: hypothetical protein DRQ40_06320 [Gammaproteobacteria bacterium]|nr:MAG: hypothetical protein DRQ40_06320 [Gammaproteobacteria bacterium]